jgi:hypothetical protein
MPEGICHFWCRCKLALRCCSSKILIEAFLLLATYCNVYRTVTVYMTFVMDIVQGFESVSNTTYLKLNLFCYQLRMKFPALRGGGRWMKLVLSAIWWLKQIHFPKHGCFERNSKRWDVFKMSYFLLQHTIVTTVGRTVGLYFRFKSTIFFCFWHCYIWYMYNTWLKTETLINMLYAAWNTSVFHITCVTFVCTSNCKISGIIEFGCIDTVCGYQ